MRKSRAATEEIAFGKNNLIEEGSLSFYVLFERDICYSRTWPAMLTNRAKSNFKSNGKQISPTRRRACNNDRLKRRTRFPTALLIPSSAVSTAITAV